MTHCRCGASLAYPAGWFTATYNAPDGHDYCCADCYDHAECSCSFLEHAALAATRPTPRLDALLERLEAPLVPSVRSAVQEFDANTCS